MKWKWTKARANMQARWFVSLHHIDRWNQLILWAEVQITAKSRVLHIVYSLFHKAIRPRRLIGSCMFAHMLTSPYTGAWSHSRGSRCLGSGQIDTCACNWPSAQTGVEPPWEGCKSGQFLKRPVWIVVDWSLLFDSTCTMNPTLPLSGGVRPCQSASGPTASSVHVGGYYRADSMMNNT